MSEENREPAFSSSPDDFPWVQPDDQLFTAGQNVRLTAFPHFIRADLWKYAIGYRRAADLLIESLISKPHDLDFIVYPVVFLYRHYIELQVKCIVVYAQSLLDGPLAVPKHHDILKLWSEARVLIEKALPDASTNDNELAESYVRQFHAVDGTSYAFRYPLDKKGQPVMSVPDHINLPHLKDTMTRLGNFLDGTVEYLSVNLGWKHDDIEDYY